MERAVVEPNDLSREREALGCFDFFSFAPIVRFFFELLRLVLTANTNALSCGGRMNLILPHIGLSVSWLRYGRILMSLSADVAVVVLELTGSAVTILTSTD